MADAITLEKEDAELLRRGLNCLPPLYRTQDEHKRLRMLYARLDRVITGKRRGLRKKIYQSYSEYCD